MNFARTRWVIALALAVMVGACAAQAQNASKYTLLVGSSFLCDSTDSPACPATAKAARGDSYEFSGVGTFDAQDKTVKGAGTFTHKSTNGRVLETGVWTVEDLISFVSYGPAPSAMLLERNSFNSVRSDPRRLKIRMLYEPIPTGGLAIFRIQLMSIAGVSRNAVLQVNCALGDVPTERSAEGIRLSLGRSNSEYSEEVSGRVMFLALKPDLSTPANMLEQKAKPKTPQEQSQKVETKSP